LIFDLDGTLFNTTFSMQTNGNYALEKLGYPPLSADCYAAASGGSVPEFVRAVLQTAGDREGAHSEDFWKYYREKEVETDGRDPLPYEGILSSLKELHDRGKALAVLSNKNHEACSAIVEACFGSDLFDVVQGSCDGVIPKPDPSGILHILDRGGFEREDCLYVGDTQIDIRAGKNAGVETVAVLWGYRTREQLLAERPNHLISHPRELLDLV